MRALIPAEFDPDEVVDEPESFLELLATSEVELPEAVEVTIEVTVAESEVVPEKIRTYNVALAHPRIASQPMRGYPPKGNCEESSTNEPRMNKQAEPSFLAALGNRTRDLWE